MPKLIAPLSARKVDSLLKQPGLHCVGPAGLYLKVSEAGSASWIARRMVRGRATKRGLGSFPEVSLAQARSVLTEETEARPVGVPSFAEVVAQYIANHEAGWANVKHRKQWETTLDIPSLNRLPVNVITTQDVLAVIGPNWTKKTETALRTRGRIEKVLGFAKVLGHRDGENPARWVDHLDKLLPAPDKVRTIEHLAAAPWQDVPTIYATLCSADGVAARMLRLQILTAVRPGEARLARWEHIDGDTWVIPATMTKQKREHRVPLSDVVVELLGKRSESGLVFPSPLELPLSDMAATMLLRGMEYDFTAHGFRSSFKDWCDDTEAASDLVSEQALGHAVGNKVRRSYARSDGFDRRRVLMNKWAAFVTDPEPVSNVVALAS